MITPFTDFSCSRANLSSADFFISSAFLTRRFSCTQGKQAPSNTPFQSIKGKKNGKGSLI